MAKRIKLVVFEKDLDRFRRKFTKDTIFDALKRLQESGVIAREKRGIYKVIK